MRQKPHDEVSILISPTMTRHEAVLAKFTLALPWSKEYLAADFYDLLATRKTVGNVLASPQIGKSRRRKELTKRLSFCSREAHFAALNRKWGRATLD
ncbi:hypothetical protein [Rhizobium herbae]|jgi:hypothetical protein